MFNVAENVAQNCPEATSKAERKLLRAEEGTYCRGPLRFGFVYLRGHNS